MTPLKFPGRRLALLLAAILASVFTMNAASPVPSAENNGFSAGNSRYQQGDFAGAVSAYEGLVKQGEYSANLFYNLGDAYFQRGDRGRAALNFERALVLEPAHAEAAANLAFLHGKPVVAANPVWNWNAAAIGAAAMGWLGALGVALAVFWRRLRGLGNVLAIGGFAACAIGAGVILFLNAGSSDRLRAVVVAENTPAFYAPADNAKVATTLLAGADVRLLSVQGAWTYALLSDGTRAWLATNRIERVTPAGPAHRSGR